MGGGRKSKGGGGVAGVISIMGSGAGSGEGAGRNGVVGMLGVSRGQV